MGKSQYIIQFGGLPVGTHDYTFEINDTFFKGIENSEIARANIAVNAVLTKQNNLLQMTFDIEGTVGAACDRCLKDFDYPVEAQEALVIKHGNPAESTDEILVIEEGQDEFDVSQYLYEYIVLSLPARRVPCELDEERFECDEETLQKLESLADQSDGGSAPEEESNPIWEKLNKIKYNKN